MALLIFYINFLNAQIHSQTGGSWATIGMRTRTPRKVLKYLEFLPAAVGTEACPEQHRVRLSLQTKVQLDMNQATNTFIGVAQVMDLWASVT